MNSRLKFLQDKLCSHGSALFKPEIKVEKSKSNHNNKTNIQSMIELDQIDKIFKHTVKT